MTFQVAGQATTYQAVYTPRKEGRHVVMVTFAGQEVPRSPFEVNVGSHKNTNIRAYGPGLKGGVVGYPALFTVDTNGETGALGKPGAVKAEKFTSMQQQHRSKY